MTIFLEVAKTVIRDTIESIIVDSQAANKSLLGGLLRNVSLSEAKCLRLKKIGDSIPKITDGLNDEATLMELQTLVLGCIDTVKAESTALSYKEGATELKLKCLSAALTPIYLKLESLSFLNAPYDQDPLNQFNYYMTLYYAKKIARDNDRTFKPGNFLDSGRSFNEEQDQLVQKALKECNKRISSLDGIAEIAATNEKQSLFNKIRAELVLYRVYALGRAFTALQKKYFITSSMFTLNGDILEQCLSGAERVLTPPSGNVAELRERRDSLSTPRLAGAGGFVASRPVVADKSDASLQTVVASSETAVPDDMGGDLTLFTEDLDAHVTGLALAPSTLGGFHRQGFSASPPSPVDAMDTSSQEPFSALRASSPLPQEEGTKSGRSLDDATLLPEQAVGPASTPFMLGKLMTGASLASELMLRDAPSGASAHEPGSVRAAAEEFVSAPVHFPSPLDGSSKKQKRLLKKLEGGAKAGLAVKPS